MLKRLRLPPRARRVISAVRSMLRRPPFDSFLCDGRGVAAVEFAFLLPVIILLYVGAGELSEAVMTSRKVETLSRTLVDLT